MLYLLYGSDTYRRNERVNAMKAAYREKYPAALGATELGEEAELQALKDAIFAGGGLFEEKRFIVAHDLFAIHGEKLTALLKELHVADRRDINIVFVEGEIEDATDFRRFCAMCRVEAFPPLTPLKLRAWMRAYVAQHGPHEGPKHIAPQALSALEGLGPDLWRVSRELDKLITYAWTRPAITAEDVRALIHFPLKETIFPISDGMCEKKPLRALAAAARLTAGGEEPDGLIGYVIREAQNLVRARTALDEGKTSGGEKVFGINPYVWKRRVGQAKQWTAEETAVLLNRAVQLDRSWKTGADKRLALDKFLLES